MNLFSKNGNSNHRVKLGLMLGLLLAVITMLFFRGWQPGWLVFSNDGPLGQQNAAYLQPASALTGMWADLNWLGLNGGARAPSLSLLLTFLLGPVGYSKLFAGIALFLVGVSVWFFFRELGFTKVACWLGGLAAALNGDFFCTACWGVASQPICFALCYLAMGLVANLNDRPWMRSALAGLCVGIGVIEAADIGAIFSVFVAAWVVAHALIQEGPAIQKIMRGGLRLAFVAGCAAFIASSALSSLIGTQIKGVVGMAQDEQTKSMRWAEATQWSLPKREIVNVFVPGFFGFRMDTPYDLPAGMQKSHTGGAYWGFGGRDAAWDAFFETDRKGPPPGGMFRYGMGAGYAGILVIVVAIWAAVQSCRGQKSFFSSSQRKMIWFWLGVMVVSAVFMFGRFAPFYQFLYALPYASTFRNPAKFLHVFEWALLVVFGYGLHGLTTLYLERASATTRGVLDQFSVWWKQAAGFDKRWVIGTFAGLALAVVAWICLVGMRGQVESYIAELFRFGSGMDPVAAAEAATTTFNFSLGQVRWAVAVLAISVGLLALLVSGAFAGKRARMAAILLGLVVVVDLGWQARPWVIAQNWQQRYVDAAQNPVMDFLRQNTYARRVADMPDEITRAFRLDPRLLQAEGFFQSVYGSEWSQHLFPYYNIQSINVIQMPRRPLDYDAFEEAFRFYFNTNSMHAIPRKWELSSTRYIVGTAPLAQVLDQGLDSGRGRFHPRLLFQFVPNPKGGNYPMIVTNTTGPYAVVEFTGALPKAKLFSNWQVPAYDAAQTKEWTDSIRRALPANWPLTFPSLETNDLATLELLARPSFDPAGTVLLAESISAVPTTNVPPGTVEYVSYEPKVTVLKTKSTGPNVLLLNDRYDPNWQVTIDGQPAKLLRCNYLMRGVEVPPGEHQVEFRFKPDTKYLYVSLAAIALGIVLIICLCLPRRNPQPA